LVARYLAFSMYCM